MNEFIFLCLDCGDSAERAELVARDEKVLSVRGECSICKRRGYGYKYLRLENRSAIKERKKGN